MSYIFIKSRYIVIPFFFNILLLDSFKICFNIMTWYSDLINPGHFPFFLSQYHHYRCCWRSPGVILHLPGLFGLLPPRQEYNMWAIPVHWGRMENVCPLCLSLPKYQPLASVWLPREMQFWFWFFFFNLGEVYLFLLFCCTARLYLYTTLAAPTVTTLCMHPPKASSTSSFCFTNRNLLCLQSHFWSYELRWYHSGYFS